MVADSAFWKRENPSFLSWLVDCKPEAKYYINELPSHLNHRSGNVTQDLLAYHSLQHQVILNEGILLTYVYG